MSVIAPRPVASGKRESRARTRLDVDGLAAALNTTPTALLAALNIPRSSYAEAKARGASLGNAHADALYRANRLYESACQVLASGAAATWLLTSNGYLSGVAPIACARSTEQYEDALRAIEAIAAGVAA